MKDKEMSIQRLVEICGKLMEAMKKESVSPSEVGKAVYALFITGCVNNKLDDASIDRLFSNIKKEIQRQQNGK